ncbi:unnamed protein product [Rotaria sp. Silwood1]|nr:unnamed protein product [Rotaria sp. Silwood1]
MATSGKDFNQRTRQLEERIIDARSPISIDSLLDSIIALVYDSEGLKKTKNFDTFYSKFYASTRDIRERRINFDDFETIKIIGCGAFGTVDLVRRKSSGQVYAMKTLRNCQIFSFKFRPFVERRSTTTFNNFSNTELEQRLQESERIKNELEIRVRRLYDDLNVKCQEEKSLNSKLYEIEKKNIILTTENKEAQRKYELEIENRRTSERNLEEIQRTLEYEKQAKTQMDATNREWTDKITLLERQINEVNDKLKIELDSNTRLKKQNQETQKTGAHFERTYNELYEKYQDLIGIKLKIEKDFLSQQSTIEQEKNAKLMALEKIHELEDAFMSSDPITGIRQNPTMSDVGN